MIVLNTHFAEPKGYGCGSGWLTEPMALLFADGQESEWRVLSGHYAD